MKTKDSEKEKDSDTFQVKRKIEVSLSDFAISLSTDHGDETFPVLIKHIERLVKLCRDKNY